MPLNEPDNSIPYDLILLFRTGELSHEESIRLDKWIQSNPENQDYMDDILEIQELGSELEIYQSLDPLKSWENFEKKLKGEEEIQFEKAKSRSFVLNPWALSIAASSLLMALFLGFYFHGTVLQTRSGQILSKRFPDGTFIRLDPNSRIYAGPGFWVSPRKWVMEYGEVYFSVNHNSRDPFLVRIGEDKIEDLGTRFQITKDSIHEIVEVISGKVSFYRKHNPGFLKVLGPGNIFKMDIASGQFLTQIHTDSLPQVSLKSFQFLNSNLGEVVGQIERSYQVEIEFSSPEILSRKITGSYNNPSADSLLRQIALTLNLKLSKTEKGFLLSQR